MRARTKDIIIFLAFFQLFIKQILVNWELVVVKKYVYGLKHYQFFKCIFFSYLLKQFWLSGSWLWLKKSIYTHGLKTLPASHQQMCIKKYVPQKSTLIC